MEPTPKSLDQTRREPIYVKDDIFELIKSDRKTSELRVAYGSFSKIKASDALEFRASSGNKKAKVLVTATRLYKSFEELFAIEDMNTIAPGFSKEKIDDYQKRLFRSEDVEKYGLVVIDFERLI